MRTTFVNQFIRVFLFAFILYVVATIVVCFDLPKIIWADWKKEQTLVLLESYKSSLDKYYDKYGSYPVSCTNIVELLCVLEGQHIRDCNSNEFNFFEGVASRKRICDAYGRPLELIKNVDGTNLIIRSTGNCRFDSKGKALYGWVDIDTATVIKKTRRNK